MVCDYLHSFYTKPVQIFVGGQPQTITIWWFRAPAGARQLPIPNTFFSHVWDDHGEALDGEPGELPFGRVWDQGRNPGYQGLCFRGDPAWFATGQFPAGFPVGQAPGPCLCQILPAQAAGGVVLTGAATVPCQPFFAPPGHTASVQAPSGFNSGNLVYAAATGNYSKLFFTILAFSYFLTWGPSGAQCGASPAGWAYIARSQHQQVAGACQYLGNDTWFFPGGGGDVPNVTFTITNT